MVCVSSGDADSDQRLETLLALAETVDIRDQGSAGHSQTVGRYAEQIARELGLPVTTADRVRLAGMSARRGEGRRAGGRCFRSRDHSTRASGSW